VTTETGGELLMEAPIRWDEACYAIPAMRAMVASGIAVGVLCEEGQRGFWDTVAGLKIVDFPRKSKVKSIAASMAGQWQASLVWEPGLAAEIFQAAGIPRRLGPDLPKLRRRLSHPMKFRESPLEHRVRYYLAAVEELGVETGRAEFFAPAELGGERMPDRVLLCPGSDYGPSHEWLLERWIALAGLIRESGRRVSLACVEGVRGMGRRLAEALQEPDFHELQPSAEVLPVLARYAWMVSADGSLPHLAAHGGVTCVTLFGPNDPAWKRPLGRRHAVVRRHVECAPCLLAKCPLDLRCQHELEVERVWRAVQETLA
jgi:heptosyltransferase-2